MLDFDEALGEVMLKQQQHVSVDEALVLCTNAVLELRALYPDESEEACCEAIAAEVPRLWALAQQANG
jgi:hypothetical protein